MLNSINVKRKVCIRPKKTPNNKNKKTPKKPQKTNKTKATAILTWTISTFQSCNGDRKNYAEVNNYLMWNNTP